MYKEIKIQNISKWTNTPIFTVLVSTYYTPFLNRRIQTWSLTLVSNKSRWLSRVAPIFVCSSSENFKNDVRFHTYLFKENLSLCNFFIKNLDKAHRLNCHVKYCVAGWDGSISVTLFTNMKLSNRLCSFLCSTCLFRYLHDIKR